MCVDKFVWIQSAVQDQARQLAPMCPQVPSIKSLYVENIDFHHEMNGFLDVTRSPLGAIGMSLTSLKFGKVTIMRNPGASEHLNSQSIATALRWLFFTKIASLPKLKELCLPQPGWELLMSCGQEV